MFALLLAQMLGLMHGVVHGSQMQALDSGQEHHHVHDHDQGPHADHGTGWLESLFSSHDANSDCRLFDQASHGSAAPALPALSLPILLSSFVVDIPQGEELARWAALFDARPTPDPLNPQVAMHWPSGQGAALPLRLSRFAFFRFNEVIMNPSFLNGAAGTVVYARPGAPFFRVTSFSGRYSCWAPQLHCNAALQARRRLRLRCLLCLKWAA
ncbi:hypothetical protein LP415_09630 [Polaromonas sp. P1(28)-8]|nr:hypothetical protein LP415_09630 [Polaromonas sp. P1(28)-8]